MKTTITILRNTHVRILTLGDFSCIGLKLDGDEFFYECDGHGGRRPSVESTFPEDVADWLNDRLVRRGLPYRVFSEQYAYERTYDI